MTMMLTMMMMTVLIMMMTTMMMTDVDDADSDNNDDGDNDDNDDDHDDSLDNDAVNENNGNPKMTIMIQGRKLTLTSINVSCPLNYWGKHTCKPQGLYMSKDFFEDRAYIQRGLYMGGFKVLSLHDIERHRYYDSAYLRFSNI